jgi:hypothetical protein
MDVFKMKDKKLSNLPSCFVKNYHILKWDFMRTTFLGSLTCFHPLEKIMSFATKKSMTRSPK